MAKVLAYRKEYYQRPEVKKHKSEYDKNYRREHTDLFKAGQRRWYLANQKEIIEKQRKRQQNEKRIVIAHYSSRTMACKCGFSDIRALSIDHINGGGRKQKKQLRKNLYHWLIQSKFPAGFQVLCMNCQFIKVVENGENRRLYYGK